MPAKTTLGRRAVLAGGLSAGLTTVTGCTPFQASRADRPRSADGYAAAAAYSEAAGGQSLLIAREGEIVFERYANGGAPDTAIMMQSATKSFWGVAAAAMMADGLLDFDERAAETLSEWRGDPRRGAITLRHLMTLTSGLAEDIPALQGAFERPTWAPDKYAHAVSLRCVTEPGSVFRYGPSHYYAFGEILRRKLAGRGQNPLDYLRSRILDPIGCSFGRWVHDGAGHPHIPNGCYMTARQWLLFGRLVLDRGRWSGREIIPADLLSRTLVASVANPGFGLNWWLNMPGGRGSSAAMAAPAGSAGGFIYHDGLTDMFAALGAGRNGLYVIPSLSMIIIRQVETAETVREDPPRSGRAFSDHAFMARIMEAS